MCGPTSFSAGKTKASSKPKTSSSWMMKFSGLFALVVAALPLLISELLGGWTTEYTSPAMYGWTPEDQAGKVVIVTGANTGIGYETSLELAAAGAHVVVACRTEKKGLAAIERIKAALSERNPETKAGLTFLPLDLASLKSVEEFAEKFRALGLPSLDTLVLNAGVMKSPGADFTGETLTYGFDTTRDGLEYHIGVNHVGHFYLTQLLLGALEASPGLSRVVAVSSIAEQGSYDDGFVFGQWLVEDMPADYEDGRAYGQSKLANLMFANELAKRYEGRGVTAYACHPGIIQTELSRHLEHRMEEQLSLKSGVEALIQQAANSFLQGFFSLTLFAPRGGALTQLHLATAPSEQLVAGGNYHPVGRLAKPGHPQGSNATLQALLWDETEKIIQQLV